MKKRRTWLIVLGVFLIAANLRLPITMMPPLLATLARSGVLPHALAGLVTTIPLAMFALVSPLMGRLGAKHGVGRVLLVSAVALVIGAALRLVPNAWVLLLGTALCGVGISGGNVLLPALIKSEFPHKIAVMTAFYTTTMSLVASIGTGTAGALGQSVGSSATLALLGSVSILALLAWVAAMPQLHATVAQTTAAGTRVRLTNLPLAWLIALFFGLQSILYYSLLTWLPSIWQHAGLSAVSAGNLATIFQLCAIPLYIIIPNLAEKRHGLMLVVGIAGGGFVAGLLLMLLGPVTFLVQAFGALIAGVGTGAAFSACIVLFQKKAQTAAGTASLSGMAQSGGYLLAAVGPVGFSWLAAALGWTSVLWLCLALSLLLWLVGVVIVRQPAIKA